MQSYCQRIVDTFFAIQSMASFELAKQIIKQASNCSDYVVGLCLVSAVKAVCIHQISDLVWVSSIKLCSFMLCSSIILLQPKPP